MNLRINEKPILNDLNNHGKVYKSQKHKDIAAKNPNFIKFKLPGKILTTEMKVNVLVFLIFLFFY